MKRILTIATLIFIAISYSYSQDDNEWINRTNYIPTENCIDSINCYSKVTVDLNLLVIPDSAVVTFNIGTTYGANDIFTTQLVRSESMFQKLNVMKDSVGNATVTLGEYMIDEKFFVDILIE